MLGRVTRCEFAWDDTYITP